MFTTHSLGSSDGLIVQMLGHLFRCINDDPANAGYYRASAETRLSYATAYLGLLGFLAVMTHDVHEMLGAATRMQ